MNGSDRRILASSLLLIVALSMMLAMHHSAAAEGLGCNRTAPQLADKQKTAEPEILHRCPKISTKKTHRKFLLQGFVPLADDEDAATAAVLQKFTNSCPNGSARINRITLRPEENGEPLWSYIAVGECL